MKWFQAGEDLTFDIELVVGGVPTQPDAGSATFSVRDQSGEVIADLGHKALAVPGTTASIVVPAVANQLAEGSDTESRFVTLSYVAAGQSRQQRASYSLHRFLPLEADCNAVRSLLGVAADELPDDDIELIPAYFELIEANGDTLASAFTATNTKRGFANRALTALAALDAIPSLQLRITQSRQNENASFSRFASVNFERLRQDLRAELSDALNGVTSNTTLVIPTLFLVSTPTDPVTNT